MPRRPNNNLTSIYWIMDLRPEIIADGYSSGKPFYCGKTIFDPQLRLFDHRGRDSRRHPNRPIAKRLAVCGDHVRLQVMEVVPVGKDWAERERFWIRMLRFAYPDCVNVADGGSGAAGCIPSEETRRKRGISLRNSPKKQAAVLARTGKPSGHKHTEETKQRLREMHLGMKASEAARAKMRESRKNVPPHSAERIRKIADWHRGKKRSAESCKRISDARLAYFARKREEQARAAAPE